MNINNQNAKEKKRHVKETCLIIFKVLLKKEVGSQVFILLARKVGLYNESLRKSQGF